MRDIEIVSIGPVNRDHDPPVAEAHTKVWLENLQAREMEVVEVTVQVAWEQDDTSQDMRAKVLEETRSALRHALSVCESSSDDDLGKELLAPVTQDLEPA